MEMFTDQTTNRHLLVDRDYSNIAKFLDNIFRGFKGIFDIFRGF
jgi:hypothetical protein